jgi:hypothetical protein
MITMTNDIPKMTKNKAKSNSMKVIGMAKPMVKAPKKVTVAKVSMPKKAMPTKAQGKAFGVMGTKPVKPMK